MSRFLIIAHDAEFGPPINGVRFVKFEPFKPILREQFEATKLAEVRMRLDEAGDRLRATGRSFVATVVHVRNSGRKPAGFDKARLKIEHDVSHPAQLVAAA
ncbi:hypothetical protein GG804_01915 [Sphingomonas histidinilytica]|uniref:hypothetical protein n=1 Tax=Sphingomonadales TaxID=204457 RepID=UPI0007705CE5|nr:MULTISPECIES: hypothetical protein [Sphingomonadaceae]AMK23264.1 hypothetical protein K426_11640 [Sphingobium sp. TKS]MBO9375513.1 hypothetical protein [Rhizorhabdus histidinilytica]MCF8709059.1 hypothetical protein [Rhizorhapis sp. SPR117]